MEIFVRLAYLIVEFNMSLEEDREIEQIPRREDVKELFPNLHKFCAMISLHAYDGKSVRVLQ